MNKVVNDLDAVQKQHLLRLLIEDVRVTGWHVELRLRIALDEPPPDPRQPERTPDPNEPLAQPHRLSSKDGLHSVGGHRRRVLPYRQVGRHSWETEMRRLDDVEAARPVWSVHDAGKHGLGNGSQRATAPGHTLRLEGDRILEQEREEEVGRRPWVEPQQQCPSKRPVEGTLSVGHRSTGRRRAVPAGGSSCGHYLVS